MKNRELVNLLNRAAAAIETPGDLDDNDTAAIVDDLRAAAANTDGMHPCNHLTLESARIGDWVIFVPLHAKGDPMHTDCQRGVITSKNDVYVFVRFRGPGGEACLPYELVPG